MVFQIVALIFLLVNGSVSDRQIGDFHGKATFATQALCDEYLASDAGGMLKASITMQAASHNAAATFSCVAVDDNTI